MKMRNCEDIKQYNKILMYGIGNQFKECYKIFKREKVLLFDGNPEKTGIQISDGNVIHSSDEISKYYDKESCIVISSISHQYEIAKFLVEEKGISTTDIFMYTSEWYESNVYKRDLIDQNWSKIVRYSEKFADEESRRYYLNAIMARKERNPLLLKPNSNCISVNEYADIVKLEKDDRIIDCGAYTGDTAELYLKKLNGECQIYAIEPYKENYLKMQERICNNNWGDKVKTFNCAVGNERKKIALSYNEGDFGMAISVSNKNGKENQDVEVETLDHLLRDKHITYIKMDIEGEERNALAGAKELIKKNKPKLMISAYHKIEDFWELPEIIWDVNPNYKIYVGHAPNVSTEMEFYCIDGEMVEK